MEILLTRLHELRTHVCHVQRLAEGRGTPHALREAHAYQHVPRGAKEVPGAQRPSRRPLREKAVGIAGSSSIVRRRPDLGLKEILRREGEQGQRVAASQSMNQTAGSVALKHHGINLPLRCRCSSSAWEAE